MTYTQVWQITFVSPGFLVKRYKSLPPPPSVPLSFKVILTLLKPLPSVLYTSALCMVPQCLLFSRTWTLIALLMRGRYSHTATLLKPGVPLFPQSCLGRAISSSYQDTSKEHDHLKLQERLFSNQMHTGFDGLRDGKIPSENNCICF